MKAVSWWGQPGTFPSTAHTTVGGQRAIGEMDVAPNIREHRGWQCQGTRGFPFPSILLLRCQGVGSDRAGSNVGRRAGLSSIASSCASLRICKAEWCVPNRGVVSRCVERIQVSLALVRAPGCKSHSLSSVRVGDVMLAEALGWNTPCPRRRGVGAQAIRIDAIL